MNNRFAAEFTGGLPEAVKAAIPAQQLDAMAHNPQALLSPEAQDQLQTLIARMGTQGVELYQQVLQALRQSLDVALSQVFVFALFAVIIAFIINFFIKEIPLRKQHTMEPLPQKGQPKGKPEKAGT